MAHFTFLLASRLCLHSSRRESQRGVQYLFIFIDHDVDWWILAWRELEVCFLGRSHGLALGFHKLIKNKIPDHWLLSGLGWLATFLFVSVCWIFFRAADFPAALEIIQRIAYHTIWQDFIGFGNSRFEISMLLIAVFLIVLIPQAIKNGALSDCIMYHRSFGFSFF